MNKYGKPFECPQCGRVPKISYVCGEYFIDSNSGGACFCDTYHVCHEMRSTEKRLVYEWNVTVLRADFMMYLGACQARFEME